MAENWRGRCTQRGSGRIWGLVLIVVAAAMAAGGGRSSKSSSPAMPSQTAYAPSPEQERQRLVRAGCRQFIRREARDPDSIEFLTQLADTHVEVLGGGEYSNVQKVRGANGFGGKSVDWYFCKLRVEGEEMRLLSLSVIKP